MSREALSLSTFGPKQIPAATLWRPSTTDAPLAIVVKKPGGIENRSAAVRPLLSVTISRTEMVVDAAVEFVESITLRGDGKDIQVFDVCKMMLSNISSSTVNLRARSLPPSLPPLECFSYVGRSLVSSERNHSIPQGGQAPVVAEVMKFSTCASSLSA